MEIYNSLTIEKYLNSRKQPQSQNQFQVPFKKIAIIKAITISPTVNKTYLFINESYIRKDFIFNDHPHKVTRINI